MSENTQAFEREISIQVRSPSLDETLNVQAKLSATVLSLKEAIFSIHPTHPIAENQRIIYSGKLLQDNEILSTVLKNFDVEVTPTFHLVVKPSLQPQQQQAQQPLQTETRYPEQHISPPPPQEQVGSTQPTFEIPSSLPRFEAPQYQTPTPRYATQSVLPGGYQVVLINGQYYLAPVLTVTQPIPEFSFSSAYLEQPTNSQPQPVYHPMPDQAQAQPPQAQQPPPAAAAAAAPAVALPNAQRAASIWLALKLVVVLFMVCQDASIERIFIFHFIAFVFFLYQTNRLRFVLRRVRAEDLNNRFRFAGQRAVPPVQPQQPPQHNEGVSTGVNNNNNQENLTQRRGQNNEEATPTPTTTVETPVRPPTFLDACKRGAFTFFASLWPTYGQDARIAQAFENEEEREGLEEF